jgi:hypothetical protein
MIGGGSLDQPRDEVRTHPWYHVMWLTGVDYFSSLAYQPGIALIAAGPLSPPATLILVAVTLVGALPVYAEVARRSYAGQGSIAMLEHLLSGWAAKIFVLVLLGFAATDFVITMTLSAADAARHAIENPYLGRYVGNSHMLFTISLLLLLAVIFLIGLREAIEVATVIAIPYLFLNLIVLFAGGVEIARHPEVFTVQPHRTRRLDRALHRLCIDFPQTGSRAQWIRNRRFGHAADFRRGARSRPGCAARADPRNPKDAHDCGSDHVGGPSPISPTAFWVVGSPPYTISRRSPSYGLPGPQRWPD